MAAACTVQPVGCADAAAALDPNPTCSPLHVGAGEVSTGGESPGPPGPSCGALPRGAGPSGRETRCSSPLYSPWDWAIRRSSHGAHLPRTQRSEGHPGDQAGVPPAGARDSPREDCGPRHREPLSLSVEPKYRVDPTRPLTSLSRGAQIRTSPVARTSVTSPEAPRASLPHCLALARSPRFETFPTSRGSDGRLQCCWHGHNPEGRETLETAPPSARGPRPCTAPVCASPR